MSSDVAVSWQEEPGVGRAFVIGSIVGTVVCFGAMTLAGVVGGLGPGASLGLAAFVAFGGGLGFGGMFGGVAGAARMEKAHAIVARPTSVAGEPVARDAPPARSEPASERDRPAASPEPATAR